MKIVGYSIEETFNKTFLWRYSKNLSYIRQLLYVFFEKEPDKAEDFWKAFKIETIDRVATQITDEIEQENIVNFSERGRCLVGNWEYIIDEFLMCFSPYYGLVVIFGQSIEDLFDNVANWFLNKMGWIAIQLFSEINELQYPEYHTYNKHIREMYSTLSNVSTDLSNYIMIQPYDPYVDALHITSTVSEDMSISKFERLVQNLNIENRILRKFDLKMINSFIRDSETITRNIMLTVVLRYAIISKTTGKKPITLVISEEDTKKITYNDVISEMRKMLNEEEINYLYEVLEAIKISGISIETLI